MTQNFSQIPMATIDIPKEIVKLPSGGKLYPVDSPLHEGEVEIYALTAHGEDLLTTRSFLKRGVVLDKLIQGAIVNRMINIDDMLLGDTNVIMVAYRITGYGPNYSVEVECPNCGEKNERTFNLSEMPLIPLGAEPIAEGVNKFEFMLPISKRRVYFKLLTKREDKQVTEIVDASKKATDGIERNVTARLFASIISINDEEDRTKLRMLIDTMPAGDSLALREYIQDVEPGIDLYGELECKNCGEKREVEVPLSASFFWPGLVRKSRRHV